MMSHAVARALQKARLSHSTSVANANNTAAETKTLALTADVANKRSKVDTEVGPETDGDSDDKAAVMAGTATK